MTNRALSRMAAAGFTILLLSGNAAAIGAQSAKPMADTTHKHPSAMAHKTMSGMGHMPEGPHHALAMAYGTNLATFAHALHDNVARSKKVDPDVAGPAVAEMRRSFDQMKEHHQAMMSAMSDQMKTSMKGMMQDLDNHLTALAAHLTELEAELHGATPAAAKVTEHTAEILKQCDGLMKMAGKGMAHPM